MRISDWSSDVCSSDLQGRLGARGCCQIKLTLVPGQRRQNFAVPATARPDFDNGVAGLYPEETARLHGMTIRITGAIRLRSSGISDSVGDWTMRCPPGCRLVPLQLRGCKT